MHQTYLSKTYQLGRKPYRKKTQFLVGKKRMQRNWNRTGAENLTMGKGHSKQKGKGRGGGGQSRSKTIY